MVRLAMRRPLHRAKEAAQRVVAAALLHLVLRPLGNPVWAGMQILSMEVEEEEVTSEAAGEVIRWAEVGRAFVAMRVCRHSIVQPQLQATVH